MRLFVYAETNKKTSGQRFFLELALRINTIFNSSFVRSDTILFNISAPIIKILTARLLGKRVSLRVDGLYFDRLSENFINKFSWPVRYMLTVSKSLFGEHLACDLANLINKNWVSFVRIFLAHHIIYQSEYCREVHSRYFPKKKSSIIVNGANYQLTTLQSKWQKNSTNLIKLITIYDDWRPSKRISDLIEFVRWVNEEKGITMLLTLLGYTGKFAQTSPPEIKTIVETRPYFKPLPKFKKFEGDIESALLESDIFITFSQRDACPNIVIEAMAYGLPVVALASGGLPDIVGDAGVLIHSNEKNDFFGAARYEADFSPIDFSEVLLAIMNVMQQIDEFHKQVRHRFETTLGMDVVANRYIESIKKQ